MVDKDKIELTGKIAKFPKNTKAVNALKFLENIKVNPKKLWYIIIESQCNELKMVKYNRNNDESLIKYTNALKQYYKDNCKDLTNEIDKITIVGESDFSIIKNIPHVILENNKTLLSKITEDLIKLLAQ